MSESIDECSHEESGLIVSLAARPRTIINLHQTAPLIPCRSTGTYQSRFLNSDQSREDELHIQH